MRADDILKIMAIDDEPRDLAMLQRYAGKADHPKCRLTTFSAVEPACLAIAMEKPDVIFVDDCLDGNLAAEKTMQRLRDHGFTGGIAVLSSIRQPGRSQHLIRSGAFYHFDKNDLTFPAFMELIDLAMATGRLLRFQRSAG